MEKVILKFCLESKCIVGTMSVAHIEWDNTITYLFAGVWWPACTCTNNNWAKSIGCVCYVIFLEAKLGALQLLLWRCIIIILYTMPNLFELLLLASAWTSFHFLYCVCLQGYLETNEVDFSVVYSYVPKWISGERTEHLTMVINVSDWLCIKYKVQILNIPTAGLRF